MEANTDQDDMNWEEYMNVVTTYSCKSCSFTCTTPSEMGTHIKNTHMLKRDKSSNLSPTENTVLIDSTIETTVAETTVVSTNADAPVSTTVSISVESNDRQIDDGRFFIVKEVPENSDIQEAVKLLDPPTYTVSSEDQKTTGANFIIPSEVVNTSIGEYSIIADECSEEPSVTKELFLCAQCSAGFGTIDECREHMIADHNLLAERKDGESVGGGISVGVQAVQRKKPGRKKKSEMESLPPKPIIVIDEDEDWEPGYDISAGRESRRKRKIRPPRSLKDDYYLGKKKKKKERRSLMDGYNFKCKLFGCHAKFRQSDALAMHSSCHNGNDFNFTCFQCQELFDQWKQLRLHLWKKHDVDCDLFICELCGTKTDTYHKLAIHREIHSENRPYTCDICGKGFKQFSQMRNHQLIHSEYRLDEPGRWYCTKQCEICQRVFANRKCLRKHVQAVHGKEKPYQCPFCSHSSSRKAMLDLHVRAHTGDKPFKCDVCAYATGDHNSLRRHKMRHTGQRKYKCQYCPYACIQATSLKTHMKNKHPGMDGIYACDACIFKTVNKLSYEHHLLDHKNGLISDAKTTRAVLGKAVQATRQTEENQSLEATMIEMHVQTMPTGEAQIRAEDLTRLSNCEELVSGDISAATLIYQALSAISQNPQDNDGSQTQTAHDLGGVQTLIKSSSTEMGVTTHTITFYVPSGGTVGGHGEQQQVYFEEPFEGMDVGSTQTEVVENQPTVIAVETSEAELEGMSFSLVPVTATDGSIVLEQAVVTQK